MGRMSNRSRNSRESRGPWVRLVISRDGRRPWVRFVISRDGRRPWVRFVISWRVLRLQRSVYEISEIGLNRRIPWPCVCMPHAMDTLLRDLDYSLPVLARRPGEWFRRYAAVPSNRDRAATAWQRLLKNLLVGQTACPTLAVECLKPPCISADPPQLAKFVRLIGL
jgi:hypothetical protein